MDLPALVIPHALCGHRAVARIGRIVVGNIVLKEMPELAVRVRYRVRFHAVPRAVAHALCRLRAGLKKLETQEQKYSAELDKALTEYAELKAQAADFDPVELYEARQAIRPAQEKAAEQQLEDALQKKPSFSLLLNAKQETSRLLKEDTEERQVRQMLIRRQRSDPQKPKHFQR